MKGEDDGKLEEHGVVDLIAEEVRVFKKIIVCGVVLEI